MVTSLTVLEFKRRSRRNSSPASGFCFDGSTRDGCRIEGGKLTADPAPRFDSPPVTSTLRSWWPATATTCSSGSGKDPGSPPCGCCTSVGPPGAPHGFRPSDSVLWTRPPDPYILPWQQVDKGAIRFVLSGANIMCPGLTSPGAKMTPCPKGSVVVSSSTVFLCQRKRNRRPSSLVFLFFLFFAGHHGGRQATRAGHRCLRPVHGGNVSLLERAIDATL